MFVGLLAISLLVGFYYAFVDRKKNSVENYYFGERKMATVMHEVDAIIAHHCNYGTIICDDEIIDCFSVRRLTRLSLLNCRGGLL